MAREKKAAAEGAPDPASLSFEAAIEWLQTIVEELEGGSLSLEESIARYEEGVRLSRRLTQTLDEAEKRIERLTEDERGRSVTEPLELDPPAAEGPGRSGRPGAEPGAGEGELPF